MSSVQRSLLTLGFFAVVALWFTWPLAASPHALLLSRHFDVYTMVWLIGAAPTVSAAGTTPLSSWPAGESLMLLDSSLLFGLARLVGRAVDPVWFVSACTLIGPILSAWAAERAAFHCLGARWPWSLIAGLAYGFSGIATTALLEGHVYFLFNPWLPLLAWAWFRAVGGGGRWYHGAASGLCFALALSTSAYAGVCAALLVLVWFVGGARRRTLAAGPLVAAAAVAVPVAIAYVATVVSSPHGAPFPVVEAITPDSIWRAGSTDLAKLLAWSPSADLSMHSNTPSLALTALALCLFAPKVLAARGWWVECLVLGGGATVLALGSSFQLGPVDVPGLLRPLATEEITTWFRFPARLMWLSGLGLGMAAAAVASQLARRRWAWAVPLIAFATADAVVIGGAPFRTEEIPAASPSAYQGMTRSGALLELLPDFHGRAWDEQIYTRNLVCYHQQSHGAPLVNGCLLRSQFSGTDHPLVGELEHELLAFEPDPEEIRSLASGLDVAYIAVRPDLLPAGSREDVLDGMAAAFGAPTARSRDAGEYVVLYDTAALPTRPAGLPAEPAEEGR